MCIRQVAEMSWCLSRWVLFRGADGQRGGDCGIELVGEGVCVMYIYIYKHPCIANTTPHLYHLILASTT